MDKTNRPAETDERPVDGPLTQLVNEEVEPQPVDSGTDELEHPTGPKHTGSEDYASGTAEHDDDREGDERQRPWLEE
jgi:hypothetical protein